MSFSKIRSRNLERSTLQMNKTCSDDGLNASLHSETKSTNVCIPPKKVDAFSPGNFVKSWSFQNGSFSLPTFSENFLHEFERPAHHDVIVISSDEEVDSQKSKTKAKIERLIKENRYLNTHYSGKMITCSLCNRQIPSVQLKQHMRNIHEIRIVYDCEICSRDDFESKLALRKHILNLHSMHCCVCKKLMPNKKILVQHRKSHGGDPYDCKFCAKSFLSKDMLVLHCFRQHPASKFSCYNCKKFYPTLERKVRHQNVFHKKKPYRCLICKSSFTVKSMYNMHAASGHCLYKRKTCLFCKSSFGSNSIYSRHMSDCKFKRTYSRTSTKSFTDESCVLNYDDLVDELLGVDSSWLQGNLSSDFVNYDSAPKAETKFPTSEMESMDPLEASLVLSGIFSSSTFN